jgi:MYXO-CTERM domain-containing protein
LLDVDAGLGGPLSDGEFVSGTAFCHGDSGGAALDQNGRLVGIVSRTGAGGSCEAGPDIYTAVASHMDFLTANLPPPADDAGASPNGSPTPAAESTTKADGGATTYASTVGSQSSSNSGCAVAPATRSPGNWILALVAIAIAIARRHRSSLS